MSSACSSLAHKPKHIFIYEIFGKTVQFPVSLYPSIHTVWRNHRKEVTQVANLIRSRFALTLNIKTYVEFVACIIYTNYT